MSPAVARLPYVERGDRPYSAKTVSGNTHAVPRAAYENAQIFFRLFHPQGNFFCKLRKIILYLITIATQVMEPDVLCDEVLLYILFQPVPGIIRGDKKHMEKLII